MGGYGVTADAQYLGIFLLELAVVLPERGGLGCSTGGEVEDMEGENDVLFAPVLAQGDIALADRRKGEIWCGIANLCRHTSTFFWSSQRSSGLGPPKGRTQEIIPHNLQADDTLFVATRESGQQEYWVLNPTGKQGRGRSSRTAMLYCLLVLPRPKSRLPGQERTGLWK